ncbi:MAG: Ig-like domain-containing protein, partial [Oscillospiraceae bacterium]|nr:Ig-like domain-containing protein [Oscillospiraceae bacterium]
MKRTVYALLVTALILAAGAPAFAADAGEEAPPRRLAELHLVDGYLFPAGAQLPVLPPGADEAAVAALAQTLPQTVTATPEDGGDPVALPVVWDDWRQIDTSVPGLYRYLGRVVQSDPPAYQLPFTTALSHPVAVWQEGAAPLLLTDWYAYYEGYGVRHSAPLSAVLGPGEDPTELPEFSFLLCSGLGAGDIPLFFSVDWTFPDLAGAPPGVYEAAGQVRLPACLAPADTLPPPTAALFVQPRDFISLMGPVSYDRMGLPVFSWLWEIPDLTRVRFHYAFEDGAWETRALEVDEYGLMAVAPELGSLTATGLGLLTPLLAEGRHYVQLSYEERYSNVLQIIVLPGLEGEPVC